MTKVEDAPLTTPEPSDPDATDAGATPTEPVLHVDATRIVEAALFSSGKPLPVDEIAENTGLGKRQVRSALKRLVEEYSERDTALEVGESGKDKWAMQVRALYAEATHRLAPMEIPIRVLKTLALIAYHQPILQSDLVELVGAKAYDHVRDLYERGLVKRRVHDRSFMLLTSDRFPEYFGIPASDREEIKRFLANKLGITIPDADASGNKRITSFDGTEESGGDGNAEAAPSGETEPTSDAPETAAPEAASADETEAPGGAVNEAPVEAPPAPGEDTVQDGDESA